MGCSKKRNNELLFPVAKLQKHFPLIEWWQGKEILHKIQKKNQRKFEKNPCDSLWGKFINCLRKYPHTFSKCKIEGTRYLQCLSSINQAEAIDKPTNYVKVLEYFKIFNETSRFKYKKPELTDYSFSQSWPFSCEKGDTQDRGDKGSVV
ncbi:conserved Plasmodium protein, unknown function [Plasmodium knowlesi strain H]|uniref:Uncharacterized protein n=3 Tax=Plasmodium knowlesi TaxID=5850 RepID=A0A5K1VPQ4_PLAKH|nr:uncharacterized protein PKNH_0208600 [Plasmodium knowlesi strain H]OTN66309.1 Uncharacterized protein PKNOH_S09518400 [Plasmodium knowlesi]CAA9986352.1 conserved Plasmodium protein, unknown function [Plasmodium knowlesi strain H]SBO25607.1 conserved Plasmodium protein, unknown function [Plasmodium knowlesi strain H]SBO28338.1 conserved Plasmodium protein, unknown function [Plasmodium knowlesi strain H]VVS75826.1 conserved Plasmodium protein, unknown function [Plasmodium knowlesi strain H]|eukprot:XP_002257757.1 [Plasmodium knowlesi strain H]